MDEQLDRYIDKHFAHQRIKILKKNTIFTMTSKSVESPLVTLRFCAIALLKYQAYFSLGPKALPQTVKSGSTFCYEINVPVNNRDLFRLYKASSYYFSVTFVIFGEISIIHLYL